MRRGEVWWASLPPPAGRRPMLLLSRDAAYAVRNQATVAPITTRRRNIPTEVSLGPEDGLPRACVVNLDVLSTIPLSLLEQRIVVLGEDRMASVNTALHFALALDE